MNQEEIFNVHQENREHENLNEQELNEKKITYHYDDVSASMENLPNFTPQLLKESKVYKSVERPSSLEMKDSDNHDNNNINENENTTKNSLWKRKDFKKMCHKKNTTDLSHECSICLGTTLEEEIVILSCEHKYHRSCSEFWFLKYNQTTCPLCRKLVIDESDLLNWFQLCFLLHRN